MPDRPRPPLLLVLALLALPQVAETILSPRCRPWPATGDWTTLPASGPWRCSSSVSPPASGSGAGWPTASAGARLLGGLGLAALATFGAWASTDYSYLLACRLVQGLGLATCSVTVQASLRDVLQGPALMSYFVTLGAVLAWSPAVGPSAASGWPTSAGTRRCSPPWRCCSPRWRRWSSRPGRKPVRCWRARPSPRPWRSSDGSWPTARYKRAHCWWRCSMCWCSPSPGRSWSATCPAWASAGSAWPSPLPGVSAPCSTDACRAPGTALAGYACLALAAAGATAQTLLAAVGYAEGLYWALPALPIFIGFGVAIPNLLGPALHAYDDCRGRAGALFGLAYYLLIGLGLGASTLLPFDRPWPLAAYWSLLGLVALLLARRLPE